MAFGIEMDADGVPTFFHSSETAAIHAWPLVTTRYDWSGVEKGTPVVVTHMRTRKNQPPSFHERGDGLVDGTFVGMVNRLEGGQEIRRPLLRSTLECGKKQAAEACYFAFADDAQSVAGLSQFLAQRRAERQMAHLFCTYADGRKKELALIHDRDGSECEQPATSACRETREGVTDMGKPEIIHEHVIHPAASVFPLMEGADFQSLVDSIAVHGVQNPLVSFKGEVLDGRNRLRAVMKLRDEGHKVELPCVEWTSPNGMTVTEWITAQNLDRRHLNDEARAMIGARLARMIAAEAKKSKQASQFNSARGKAAAAKKGSQSVTADSPSPPKRDRRKSEERTTAAQAAKRVKVSTHKMKQAMAVDKAIEAGEVAPEVVDEIVAGTKKIKDAVPTKSKGNAKAPAASIDDEIRMAAHRSWSNLRNKFAPGVEHKKLRAAMIALVRSEQKAFEK